MNAYELADELEKRELEAMEYGFDKPLFLATTMLRQQADRIAELEKELNHMQSFYGCDPAYYGIKQSKPVAWMNKDTLNLSSPLEENASWINPELMIPLYTHPVKQLSDEEINDIYEMWQAMSSDPVKLYECFKFKEITE